MTDFNQCSSNPQTAIVTGASSGIGAVYADRMAKRGYDLILIARREQQLEAVAQTIRDTHAVAVETVVADLASPNDLARVLDKIAERPDVTMLVNNAGTSSFVPVDLAKTAAVDAMTNLNITALVHLSLAVIPAFKLRGSGTIVNIASVAALGEMPGSAFYSASKAYVLSFTRGLAEELANTGVRVQAVLPSRTATEGWDKAGIPLASLDPATVMSVEACVDAAVAGLDLGEVITLPSVNDAMALLEKFDSARYGLLGSSQTGLVAKRYAVQG
jgi:short-subunit dehydrogenase